MAVTSLLDSSLPETVLSEEKAQEIIDLIKERFNETDHAPVAKQKEALLEGDRNDDTHMMSRKMMQTYIGSFWWHFHPQLPICKFYGAFLEIISVLPFSRWPTRIFIFHLCGPVCVSFEGLILDLPLFPHFSIKPVLMLPKKIKNSYIKG
jgi:hypothetical protein